MYKLTLCLAVLLAFNAHAKINVVATTPDLAAIAKAVGGSDTDITCLALPTEDPHFVDAKPSFITKLNRADVLIEGGAELELGWLPALLEKSRNTKIASGAPGYVRANEGIQLLEIPTQFDRSHGDIHALGNPHYLTDPANAKIVAAHIAAVFSKIDPKSAQAFQANLKKFTDDLTAHIAVWEKALAPYKGQHIVAYHDSWPYFAQRFGLNIELFLEPKPGIPPTPSHLAEVITKMKMEKARVIIVEPYVNRRTADAVARETSAVVLPVSQFPGGVKGTDNNYIQLMDYVVQNLVKTLASGGNPQ
jgi:zinc/manganese transport system substrate-binding protein